MFYETQFSNHRKEAVQVYENGRVLLTLEPGEKKYAESYDPKTSYAPWLRVTYKSHGRVDLDENKAWVWPYPDLLKLTALNEASAIPQGLIIDDKTWPCYPGIPRYIPVRLGSPWAFFERVRFVSQERKVKEGDYFKIIRENLWLKEPRSKRELREMERKLLDLAVARATAETQKTFLQTEGGSPVRGGA